MGISGLRPKIHFCKNNKYFELKGKTNTKDIARTLLEDKKVTITDLKSQKTDRTYKATIHLKDIRERYTKFELEY